MRYLLMLSAAVILGVTALFSSTPDVSFAAYHCMRIHAVKAGFGGNGNIQYVELRMDAGGQVFVGGHTLAFYDSAGTVKATFTFPANVTNAFTGESILIATSEFNAFATGGSADFTFTAMNTVGANGGDPLHPVQTPNGTVRFVPATDMGPFTNCSFPSQGPPIDSVAYGAATADYGTAAAAMPAASSSNALRLSNLNTMVTNNSTEYSLQPVATNTGTVTTGNLATDFTTPRNNMRQVLKLSTSTVGGVAEPANLGDVAPVAAVQDGGNGRSVLWYALPASVAGLLSLIGANWAMRRRRQHAD